MSVGTLALLRIADGERPSGGWIALAALSLGLGVLSKGPVALALPDRPALERYLESEERVFGVLPEEDCQSLRGSIPRPFYLLAKGKAGRRRDCLISNLPGARTDSATTGSPGTDPESPAPASRSGSGS